MAVGSPFLPQFPPWQGGDQPCLTLCGSRMKSLRWGGKALWSRAANILLILGNGFWVAGVGS